ncbi:MAG: chloride channel protein [Acetobacteraceae bacterium]
MSLESPGIIGSASAADPRVGIAGTVPGAASGGAVRSVVRAPRRDGLWRRFLKKGRAYARVTGNGAAAADGHGERPSLLRRGDFTTNSRVLYIMGIAVLASIGTSIVGVLMFRLIELITNLLYFGRFSFTYVPFSESPLGWLAVLVPIGGSIIVGLMARYGTDKIRGHGLPEAIEAILLGRSRLDAKVAILKPTSAVICIGTGGPFGAEGPIIMTGGAIGSLIAQALPVTDVERKTLLVAGAAAGMTIVFGTPVASIMLAVELLLFEWTPSSILPVAAACVVADFIRHFTGLAYPLFPYTGGVTISFAGLGGWLVIGIFGGLLSGVLTRMLYLAEDGFRRLPIHWMWWPALGGVVVGLGGLIDPNVLGLGYANIEQLLRGGFSPDQGARLLIVKAIVWAIALGSGTSGGTLAPLMMMGGAMAAAATGVLPHADAGFWPLLAMSAVLGGTLRLPFTAIFFAIGVTGNTHVLLPLVVTCFSAHTVDVLLMRRDILTEKVARHGHHVTREYHVDPFALTRVADVMVGDVETLSGDMTLHQVSNFLSDVKTRHPSFPVVDADRHVLGVADPPTVLGWRHAGRHRDLTLAELFAGTPSPSVAYPEEYLDRVVERMMEANTAHLPVVARDDSHLVGYIAWKDILRVRSKVREKETRRVVFYRVR